MRNKLVVLSIFLLAAACSKGKFSGNGANGATTTTKELEKGSKGGVNGKTVDGSSSGSGSKGPKNGTVIGSGGKDGNGGGGGGGDGGGGGGDGGGGGGGGNDPDSGITTTDDGIEFGGNGIFRVGDGRAQDSSCKSTLDTFELEGSKFSFEFNVLQDDTVLEISVNRICAIDYDDSNFISLVQKGESSAFDRQLLPLEVISQGDAALKPFSSTFTLKKGSYAIKVESEKNGAHKGDRDDFIIGNIRVNSDKPVVGTVIQSN